MKRINDLYEKICNKVNIYLADKKASRNKSHCLNIVRHNKQKFIDNFLIEYTLKYDLFETSEYDKFKIYEPKEREIYRLPYNPDRIVHHAIMNVLEEIWTKIFTRDTYSSLKGRGIHALAKKLKKDLKNKDKTTYCLKLDIKKFYPSINHDILKQIIRKKIKDKKLLKLLDGIIDSAEGVPIGNYLSQFFANLYLAYFDHWVKEELKCEFYYRYCDDIVILFESIEQLRSWLCAIKIYLRHVLKLELKSNYQIFKVDDRGIDFVGYKFYHTHTLLRKSIKKNIFKAIKKKNVQKKLSSYFGWMKYCNSKHLLQKIYDLTGIYFSNWCGKHVSIYFIKGKTIIVKHIQNKKSRSLIQFVYNNISYECNINKNANIPINKLIKICN